MCGFARNSFGICVDLCIICVGFSRDLRPISEGFARICVDLRVSCVEFAWSLRGIRVDLCGFARNLRVM